ncbi:MAG: PilC/PilY family type IV pilus protein, partial [Gammaproteobacteria bacterium]|nr:PilC/PilY family type IV pilus protein [Gammaproteobacteria bacterium]
EVGNLIDWMRGKDSYDADGDSSTTQRWVFGDPLHSSPLTVNYGAVETSPGVIDRDQPIIKLLVASNEGVIRLIDESTGAEQWSFIPKEMLASQSRLAKNAVGDHVYGVDATAVVHEIDVDNDGVVEPGDGDKIYAFVGMRRGSKDGTNDPVYNNIYAFDLTPSATLTAYTDLVTPKLMWVIEGGVGDYKLLGQTWSAPRVDTLTDKSGSTNADMLALFFGGGNSTNAESDSITPTTGAAGNAVFIADALTGERLWWASDPAEVDGSGDGPDLALTDMDYPIPGDITLLDINLDYAVDRMYFGDLSGQVWRVDLDVDLNPAGSSPSTRNGATAGHVLADLTCPRNVDGTRNCPATPIEQNWRRIYYRPNMGAVRDETYVTSGYIDYDLIFVGTGDRTDPLDALTATLPEHPVYNRLYAIRDYNFDFGPPASTPVPLVESNLYDITNGYINSTNPTEVALAKTGLTNSQGWMYSLKEASDPAWTALDLIGSRPWIGEKALARPVLFSGVVYFTTFTPANPDTATQTCSPNEGLGRVYAFNALDGRITVDMDGDGDEDQSLDLGGGIPSEVVTVIREDGTVAVVDDQTINIKNTNSVKDTFWIQE